MRSGSRGEGFSTPPDYVINAGGAIGIIGMELLQRESSCFCKSLAVCAVLPRVGARYKRAHLSSYSFRGDARLGSTLRAG